MHGSSTVKAPREKSPKDIGIELMNLGWTTLIDLLNLISKSFFRPKDIRTIPTILAKKFAKFGRYAGLKSMEHYEINPLVICFLIGFC